MTQEKFDASIGKPWTDDDVAAGRAPYKPGDGLSFLHDSEARAYLIADYPYGSLRTQMKVWYEHTAKKGTRVVNQTLNPKTGLWNNPKKSTYSHAQVQVFDANGRLETQAWHLSSPERAQAFLDLHRGNLPKQALVDLTYGAAYNSSMEASKAAAIEQGQPLEFDLRPGTPYRVAYLKATKAAIQALVAAGLGKNGDVR